MSLLSCVCVCVMSPIYESCVVTQSLVIAGKINFIENKDKVKILNKV